MPALSFEKPMEKLNALLASIPRMHDLLKKISHAKASEILGLMEQSEVANGMEEFMMRFCDQGCGEIMVAVLMFIGQKLCEAGNSSSPSVSLVL